jgi:hypothetical protein
MGRLKITNAGMRIDDRYQELAENYPGLFDLTITDPASQLMELANVADRLRPVWEPISGDERRWTEADIARQIAEGYFTTRLYRLKTEAKRALNLEADAKDAEAAAREAESLARANRKYWETYEDYLNSLVRQGADEEKGRPPRSARRVEEAMAAAARKTEEQTPQDIIDAALIAGGVNPQEEAERIIQVPTDDTAISIAKLLKGNRAGISRPLHSPFYSISLISSNVKPENVS